MEIYVAPMIIEAFTEGSHAVLTGSTIMLVQLHYFEDAAVADAVVDEFFSSPWRLVSSPTGVVFNDPKNGGHPSTEPTNPW